MQFPTNLLSKLQWIPHFDSDAFLAAHAKSMLPVSIRFNPIKQPFLTNNTASPVFTSISGSILWCESGKYLTERPLFTNDPLLHAGLYYVQEASSMFLWHIFSQTHKNNTAQKVLDLCAAPGGKSTLLASYFHDGLLVSNEVIKSRATILAENLCKWGTSNHIVTNNDPTNFSQLANFFDVMVVDAPCSGSGLFRKTPEAINEWSPENVHLCSLRQQRILADALPALKPEGLLVYATCSYSIEENEQMVDNLLAQGMVETVVIDYPDNWGIIQTISPNHKGYGYRFFPHLSQGEGFFVAVFRKKEVANYTYLKEQKISLVNKEETAFLQNVLTEIDDLSFFKQGNSIKAIDRNLLIDLQIIAGNLYIKKAGVEIGSIKGKDLIPHHEWAMSTINKNNFPRVELTLNEALQYLRRQDFLPDSSKGWCLTTYCGLPLGWMKVLPNRMNNYYPNEWRILKS